MGDPGRWPVALKKHAACLTRVVVAAIFASYDSKTEARAGPIMRKNRLNLKMRIRLFAAVAGIAILGGAASAIAQQPSPQAVSAPAAAAKAGMDVLKGAWVRPDGGYTITVKNIGADGRLEAMYSNPNLLPFSKAQATQDGATLRASFELQAGGYSGSTYELAYDPATDRLKGIYYQAVVKQKFEVYFVRK